MTDIVVMLAGQSNAQAMAQKAIAGVTPLAGVVQWDQIGLQWVAPTGAGVIELGNMLKASGGYTNVYIIVAAVGGSSLVPVAASPASNCWSSLASGSPRQAALDQVASSGKIPQFVVWIQGENEAAYCAVNPGFDMNSNYRAYLGQLRTDFMTAWGVSTSQQTWIITPVGNPNYGNTRYVMQPQLAFANGTAGVVPGPARYDLATDDGVHMSATACGYFGRRLAQQILKLQGVSGFANCGPGPQIVYAQKSGTTIAIFSNSTTGLVALPGALYLSGFTVWDYYFTRTYTIASSYLTGGYIVLSLVENPGDGNHVHIGYMIDNWQSCQSPVYDQQGVFLGMGNPLLPCPQTIETVN